MTRFESRAEKNVYRQKEMTVKSVFTGRKIDRGYGPAFEDVAGPQSTVKIFYCEGSRLSVDFSVSLAAARHQRASEWIVGATGGLGLDNDY